MRLEPTGDDLPLYLSEPEAFLPSFSHAAGLIVFQSFSVKLRVRSVKVESRNWLGDSRVWWLQSGVHDCSYRTEDERLAEVEI